MTNDAKIYVAGHRGLVGGAVTRLLEARGFTNIVKRTHHELDLLRQEQVEIFFEKEKPEYVILAAAKAGGIYANNTYRADFIYENLEIQNNVLAAAARSGVKKLLFLGSSCIYPRACPQPMKEEYLLTGPLEPTNEPYAIAKIAGIKMCQAFHDQYGSNFISVMPTNLYGPGDHFHLAHAHVLPALMRKFHEAKMQNLSAVEVWGTGNPRREFLYIDDLADALCFVMEQYDDPNIINIGVGTDVSIRDLALLIKEVVGFAGELVFNPKKPDGMPQKLLDVSKMSALGWRAQVSLEDGVRRTYDWFLKNPVRE